jgi:hypothetical protein
MGFKMEKDNIEFEETFLNYFEDIEDPRIGDNVRHFAAEFLRQYFPYKHGVPSKNNFYRFFAALKPQAFKKCFVAWIKSLKLVDEEIIAIDGCIVIIDAMGTQKKIAEQIINGGRDYMLALKGNHSTLHTEEVA